MSQTKKQRVTEILEYPFILTKFLTGGDTVTSATASASPTGLTVSVTEDTTDTPFLWVSGGIVGVTYVVTLIITTQVGRTKEFDVNIEIT
tara:strand:- start:515 stop:784 length:270 start_codon:yes stop_codon:yes gene_type:complete